MEYVFFFFRFFSPQYVFSKVISEMAVTNRTLMSHYLSNESALYLFIFVTFRNKNLVEKLQKMRRKFEEYKKKMEREVEKLPFAEEKVFVDAGFLEDHFENLVKLFLLTCSICGISMCTRVCFTWCHGA